MDHRAIFSLAWMLAVVAICVSGGCDRETPAVKAPPQKAASQPTSTDDSKAKGFPKESPAKAAPDKTPPSESPPDESTADESPPALKPPQPFAGWPEPELVLVLTGQQLGYIEPCGCTGLENQKGGLARRATLIQQLADERGWTVVPLDVGSQIKRFGKQSEIKFQYTAEALRTMGYRAATLGADDLKLSPGDLLVGTNPPDGKTSLFLSANVALIDRGLQPAYTVIEAGGKKIGVTAVLGQQAEAALKSEEIVHSPPIEALKDACRDLKQQNCDLYVLLAHATSEEAAEIAEEVPIFDLVVVPGDTPVPARGLEEMPGIKAQLARLGTKSMFAGVVGVYADDKQPLRYESVPLDDTLADSPAMLELFARYQDELKTLGLEALGARPQPHASGSTFVGSRKCGECHTKAFAKWSTTPHAHATDSLVHPPNSRGEIARHFDPECLSCHVTGWQPQKFLPYDSGYQSLEQTPALQHNGCENCHGPGSKHVAAESGESDADEATLAILREKMRLPLTEGVAEQKCLECHDDDNSPAFHDKGAFEKYWKEVEHRGMD